MGNGRLDYALGLETGSFTGKLLGAQVGVQLFTMAMDLAGKTASLAWSQIEKGGRLQDLSNRTGESVKDLTQLSHAFEMSGVSAASLPSILQRFRSSLSGIGEMGEDTTESFRLLGLAGAVAVGRLPR